MDRAYTLLIDFYEYDQTIECLGRAFPHIRTVKIDDCIDFDQTTWLLRTFPNLHALQIRVVSPRFYTAWKERVKDIFRSADGLGREVHLELLCPKFWIEEMRSEENWSPTAREGRGVKFTLTSVID